MIPAWLLRFLPQIGLALAVASAFGAALWWIDHRGYARAIADRDTRDARMLASMQAALRASEQRLAGAMAALGADYEAQRGALARAGAALQPIIIKEAVRDPRLADPALGLSPGLLDAINAARATGACATAASGRIDCTLPAAPAGAGPVNR